MTAGRIASALCLGLCLSFVGIVKSRNEHIVALMVVRATSFLRVWLNASVALAHCHGCRRLRSASHRRDQFEHLLGGKLGLHGLVQQWIEQLPDHGGQVRCEGLVDVRWVLSRGKALPPVQRTIPEMQPMYRPILIIDQCYLSSTHVVELLFHVQDSQE